MLHDRWFSGNTMVRVALRKSILLNSTKPFPWPQPLNWQQEPISYRFLHEATIIISYRFLFEATGKTGKKVINDFCCLLIF